ncbi:MAG: hypothetical protein DME17_16715 [Candidatus Rokuibacteriota bacterium]|nr:MAG: hypothetical protein DME17_16715 [Candidatus Rokubacteria bacterium]
MERLGAEPIPVGLRQVGHDEGAAGRPARHVVERAPARGRQRGWVLTNEPLPPARGAGPPSPGRPPWYSCVVSRVASVVWLVALVLVPVRARATEYTLEVSDLIDVGFHYFVRGPVGHGEGELALPELARALDERQMGRGVILYDRDLYPAGEGLARAYGAVAVRPTAYSSSEEKGLWKSVSWEGKPGERVVWVVRPSTQHWREVRELALSDGTGELRYYIPYGVTLWPRPSRAVAYPLSTLRSGEDGGSPVWDKYLSRAVDLSEGLAAVVGNGGLNGDWVYLLVEDPPEPSTFRAVIGWTYRGSGDRIQAGTGRGSILR